MTKQTVSKKARKTIKSKLQRKSAPARSRATGRLKKTSPVQKSRSDISQSAVRLKALRKEAGLSIREMASALDMSATTYQHYEDRYKKRYLPYEMVKPISSILKRKGISREALDTLTPNLTNVADDVVNITYAPLISWVQAGDLSEAVNPYEFGEPESEIAIEYERDSVLALRVRGSSINRVAPDGAIVVVDYSQQDLLPNKFYVVRQNGDATVKRYSKRYNRFEAYSTETGHPAIKLNKDLTVVGRVVRVVTEL